MAGLKERGREFLYNNFEKNKFNMFAASWINFLGSPFYYVLCTYIVPQPYDSLFVRLASSFVSIPLLFTTLYSKSLKPFLAVYWYFWIICALPATFTFLMLMNNFSGIWLIAETVMVFIVILFVADLVVMISIMAVGITSAYFIFVFYTGNTVDIDMEFLGYLIPAPLALLGGILFSYNTQKGAVVEERGRIMKSLAGSIAHEVRNPLNAISLAVKNILDYLPEKIDRKGSFLLTGERVEQIYELGNVSLNSIKRANQIITMILNDIKDKKVEINNIKNFTVQGLLNRIVAEYGYKSNEEKSRVELDIADDFAVKVDEDFFFYVIFNLMKNAIYYFEEYPDSKVTIKARIGEGSDKFNYITVHDTGPGVPEDKIGELFGDFMTSGKKDGTGLGLAFCKRTIKSFNGDIWCESKVGEYTDFIMKLPKVDPSEKISDVAENDVVIEDELKTWVLLVDDQKVNLMVNKSLLESTFRNMVCEVAENGKEAVEKVRKRNYALILMDLQMPVMDGRHAVKMIRENNDIVPIVTYSSLYQLHAKRQVLEHGFDDCLSKPISNDLLLRTVAKWTQAHYLGDYDFSKVGADVNLEGKNVLLVDDQDINRVLSAKFLKNYKINIDEAKNGKEAVEKFKQDPNKYDIVLMDVRMPIMGGVEAAQEMRKVQIENSMTSIPIIALSGDGEQESIHRYMRAGYNDYFIKGKDYEDLISLIKFWIKEEPKGGSCILGPEKKVISDKLPKAVLIEFGPMFKEEAQGIIVNIKKATEESNLDDFLFHCHALKGICGNVGADKMFEFTVYLNDVAKIQKWPEKEGWMEKLDSLMKEFDDEFEKIKADAGTTENKADEKEGENKEAPIKQETDPISVKNKDPNQ